MIVATPPLVLSHPELGRLPARRLLDCVFALAPDGTLLHLHREQCTEDGAGTLTLSDTPAHAERARCCVIPPFLSAFRQEPA